MKWLALLALSAALARADDGHEGWLRYGAQPAVPPAAVVKLGDSLEVNSAASELMKALRAPTGREIEDNSLVLGTLDELSRVIPRDRLPSGLRTDGYDLRRVTLGSKTVSVISSPTSAGVLYGAFAWIRGSNQGAENPAYAVRWVNEWDNLDGTIERGYAGRSIFFENNDVAPDLRAGQYARLLASVGINGCTINNVNANPRVIEHEFLPRIARIAAAFRPWGVRLSLSVDFASPKTIGGLDTFDPLDARVIAWWKEKADEIYRLIPDFGGFVLKADSEGRVGPSTYGRTHAHAANLLANALKPHGGILIYRGFVYDHHADWRNLKNDRARAAFDNFQPLNGQFAGNVLVQVKHGPIDFQAREPVSPLIAALTQTNQTLELQITQEYTGQQRHLCYLAPMWKQVLDFDMRVGGGHTPVKSIVRGLVGVANVGRDSTWLGSDMAMANLYAFGRLAWNPELSPERIAEEWTRQTFSADPRVVSTITALQMDSWRVYEGYTGPLGLGTLTDILRGHYGPNIESAERNGWGQWIRADRNGIGMDRTVATGTGYIGQYPPDVARMYESLKDCPDELVLFMHHLPYNYVLHSGKTVVQHVYDSHYGAAAEAERFVSRWKALEGLIDQERFSRTLDRLVYQAGHAAVWRDAICSWFLKQSGIPDDRGRAGHFPSRVEAESMTLNGYAARDVSPWENASGGKGIICESPLKKCHAEMAFHGAAGSYDIRLEYFDVSGGTAHFQVAVDGRVLQSWAAADRFPGDAPNGDNSVRQTIAGVALKPGDIVSIEGVPDRADLAAFDYIEIVPLAPRFVVDPFWPKPLPNDWLLGQTIGVSVDAQDHIWIVHRPGSLEAGETHATTIPKIAQCCAPAPPVLEFDQAGNLLASWGGQGAGYDWPDANHGITVDSMNNVWLGGAGRGRGSGPAANGQDIEMGGVESYRDNMLLKFDSHGNFLMQIGKPNSSKGSGDTANLRLPAKIFEDPKHAEIYAADGYGNHRVIVFDRDTGKYKRHWGAYGNKPSDASLGDYNPDAPPAPQFRNPVHCAAVSNDDLVYVCDRVNDRIQVFRPNGEFVKEAFVEKRTLGSGSVWDIAFSRDPEQRFIYLADGENNRVHILNRLSLEVLTAFGQGGRQPGEFYGVHSIATDSKGNIYTTETYRGQRVQRFLYQGLAPVTTADQGPPW